MKAHFPYYNLLDGLRGFAIIAVLYHHSFSLSLVVNKLHLGNGGFIGVDIFFVLSSFLIGTLLLREYLNFGNISIKQFYIRRSIRLFPPLLFATIIFIPIIFFINWKIAVRDLFYTFTYSANIARSLQHFIPRVFQPGYFAHTWSLATEEQFYLVFPIIFLQLTKKKVNLFANNHHLFLGVLTIFMTAPLLRPLLKDGIYDFPLWRIGEFSIGLITALIYANIMWRELLITKMPFLTISVDFIQRATNLICSSSLSLLSFWLLFAFILSAHENSYFVLFTVHLIISMISGLLILQVTISPNRIVKYFLGSKFIIETGIISYGLYIYHYPILKIEEWVLTEKFPLDRIIPIKGPLLTVVSLLIKDSLLLVLTLSIAYLSYKFIERPILKYKANFSRH